MEERYLDLVLVPLGLLLQAAYNICLFYTVKNHPDRTVIGLDRIVRQHWVKTMMQVSAYSLDPCMFSWLISGDSLSGFRF